MILYPPSTLAGKLLKTWYRQEMRRLTGKPDLPDQWHERIGIEVVMMQTIRFISGQPYEKWDMKNELMSWREIFGNVWRW